MFLYLVVWIIGLHRVVYFCLRFFLSASVVQFSGGSTNFVTEERRGTTISATDYTISATSKVDFGYMSISATPYRPQSA